MPARFSSNPVVKFLPGRNVELTTPLTFYDPQELAWDVPKGAIVDGASIPQIFWSIIGGPFDQGYRDASIIHDWYCDKRLRTWQATHRVFYDAMIVSGVSPAKAKTMYFAVWWRGPRWEERVTHNTNLGFDFGGGHAGSNGDFSAAVDFSGDEPEITQESVPSPAEDLDDKALEHTAQEFEALVSQSDISLEQIEQLAEESAPVLR